MTRQIFTGYQLIDLKDGSVVQSWGGEIGSAPAFPNPVTLPNGLQICGARVGEELHGYKIAEWYIDWPLASVDVNEERDARISAGFEFNGKLFQFRESDRENINGAGTLAALAIMGGAQPGDYLWHGGKEDFVWITSDNSLMKLDAFDTVNLGKAAAAWKSAHIFAARALKDQSPIPEGYRDDQYWPPKAELA